MLVKNGSSSHLIRSWYSIWLYQFGNSKLWQRGTAVSALAILAKLECEPLALKKPAVLLHEGGIWRTGLKIPIVVNCSFEKVKENFWLEANAKQLNRDHGFYILNLSHGSCNSSLYLLQLFGL